MQKGQLQSFPRTDAGTSAVMSCERLLREVPRVLPSARTMRSSLYEGRSECRLVAPAQAPTLAGSAIARRLESNFETTETSAIVALEVVSI